MAARILRNRRTFCGFNMKFLFIAIMSISACLMPNITVADAATTPCADNKKALDNINEQIAKLDKSKAPAEMARKLTKLIDQLIKDMKEVKKDTRKVTGLVNNWKGQLKDFAGTLEDNKDLLPPEWTRLNGGLDKLAEGITKKIKAFDKSSAGKALKDVNEAEKLIGKAIQQLETIKTGLNALNAYDKAMNGSASEQIEAFKFGFDQLKSKLAVDEVPGLGDFLDAYSTALEGIARNVAAYEKEFNEKLKQADTALTGTGIDIYELYIRPKSPRDKLIARLKALNDEKTRLEKERAAAECDKPEIPADPCKDPKGEPDKMKKWVDRRTETKRLNYEAAQKVYEEDFMNLSRLSFKEPMDIPSGQESGLKAVSAELRTMQRGIKENSTQSLGSIWDAKRRINEIADGIGAPQNQSLGSWNEINSFIDQLKAGLAKKQEEARKTAAAAYKEAHAKWKQEFDRAVENVNASRKKRDDAKAEYEKAVGDLLAAETKYKWNEDQIKQFDDCFPYMGNLRKDASKQKPATATKEPEPKEPPIKPISTVTTADGKLPPRRAVMSFDDVPSMTMEIAPEWHMNRPFPGLLPVHCYPGSTKLVAVQGDMEKAQSHLHNWGHSWCQKLVVEFDNGMTAENSGGGLSFQIHIPKGAKSIRKWTIYYSTGGNSGLQPLVWDVPPAKGKKSR